jgi:hypothetical protein
LSNFGDGNSEQSLSEVIAAIRAQDLEGVVAKNLNSPYPIAAQNLQDFSSSGDAARDYW